MNGFCFCPIVTGVIVLALVGSSAHAEVAAVETVLTGLHDPQGVTVRPDGTANQHELFVADTGVGRVIRIRGDQTGIKTDAITGFAAEAVPQALYFLDRDHLVVGCGGHPVVRMYEVADSSSSLSADTPTQVVDDAAMEIVFAFARTRHNDNVPDLLILVGMHREWSTGLGRIPIRAGTLDKLTSLDSNLSSGLPSRGVAVNEQGYIAAYQSDPDEEQPRGLLTFFDPATGAAVVSYPILLRQIIALAYNPANNNLYALDDGSNAELGGLYRLDDSSEPGIPSCNAVRIATIQQPTALAFAPDGTLYVTAIDDKQGKLLRVRGEL